MKVRRVDLYPDDFLTGTTMLKDDEIGVYFRICLLVYATGGPVSLEHVKSVCRSHGNTFNRCITRLESLGKIIRNGSEIDQKRCENELDRSRKRVGNASEKASKRWKNKGVGNAAASDAAYANIQHTTNNIVVETQRLLPQTESLPETQNLRFTFGDRGENASGENYAKNGGKYANGSSAKAIAEQMVEIWHQETSGTALPKVQKLSADRIAKLRKRYIEDFESDIERWRGFVQHVIRCPFLIGNGTPRRGENTTWVAGFDWVLDPKNFIKIIEGNYDKFTVPSEWEGGYRPMPSVAGG